MVKKIVGGGGAPSVNAGLVSKPKVSLPTTVSVPATNISDFALYIYGMQKVGKTSFTTRFPRCLHMMFEPGGKAYEIFQVAPTKWLEVEAYVDLLEKQKIAGELEFDNIALDTVDLMYNMCSDHVCSLVGVKHPNDANDYGKTWSNVEKTFRELIVRMARVCGLIALSHETDKEVETRSGRSYQTIMPSAQKRCHQTLAKFCDLTGNYFIDDDGSRQLLVRPSADAEAGNRIEGRFRYTDGSPILKIPMGNDADDAYNNFLDGFNNKLVKPVAVEQTKPAKKGLTIKKS